MKIVGSKTHAGIGIRETRGWANAKKRPRDPEYRTHGAFSSEISKILASGGDPGPLRFRVISEILLNFELI